MSTTRLSRAAVIALAALLAAARAHADRGEPGYEPHIRTSSPELRSVIEESVERSPTFRSLIDRIDSSNVVVYVTYNLFQTSNIEGRLMFLGSTGGRRYLLVQIGSLRTRSDQFVILGHELHHVTEVADAPSIVDPASLAQHYGRIGFVARQWQHGLAFETQAAVDVGSRVQREILESIHAEEVEARAAAGGDSPRWFNFFNFFSGGGRHASPDRRTPRPTPSTSR